MLTFYLPFKVSWIISKRQLYNTHMKFDKKGILARAKEAQQSSVEVDEGLRN